MADKSRIAAADLPKVAPTLADMRAKSIVQLAVRPSAPGPLFSSRPAPPLLLRPRDHTGPLVASPRLPPHPPSLRSASRQMGEQFQDASLAEHGDRVNTDCPYSGHDWEAIEWSIPRELLQLEKATRGEINALRVWTTVLCTEALLLLDECYLGDDDDALPEETIVDKAYGWLEEQCFACDDLDLILMDVIEDARKFALSWEIRHEVNSARSRAVDRERNSFRHMLQANKNMGELCRTLMVKHETVSTLLGPPSEGLTRWQRVFILGTALLVSLTVDVWVFQQKGYNCCVDARAFLGCSADIAAPCRGFSGDCSDLLDQFADVPDTNVANFQCLRFPRDDRPLDGVFVGAIMAAIALLIKLFAEKCFEMSNEADMPDAWLQWCAAARRRPRNCSSLSRPFRRPTSPLPHRLTTPPPTPRRFGLRRLVFGRMNWRFQDPGTRPKEWKRRASQVGRDSLFVLLYMVGHLLGNIYRKLTCARPRPALWGVARWGVCSRRRRLGPCFASFC